MLLKDNISFVKNYSFDDCRFPDTNHKGYYDFMIDNKYIIEYDGEQHFNSQRFNGIDKLDAESNFKKGRYNDLYKTIYCLNNSIPIIRIPYTHRDNMTTDDIRLETSNYVINNEGDMLKYFEIPERCPVCGEKTSISFTNNSEVLYCGNPHCKGRLLGLLTHFVSKAGMDIKGLSEQTLETLIGIGVVNDFADIFTLRNWRDKLYLLPGFGIKSVDNLLYAINDASTAVDPAHFVSALSIPGIGLAQAKLIIKRFKTVQAFVEVAETYDFTNLDGFGLVLNDNIKNWFSDETNRRVLARCLSHIMFLDTEPSEHPDVSVSVNNQLAGKTICVTGDVHIFKNRKELTDKAEACGAKVTSSVSKKTDYLVNNDINSKSSKNLKAKSLGVPIITEEQFISMTGE